MESSPFIDAQWIYINKICSGYSRLPIPDPLDDKVQAFIYRWIALDDASRQQVIAAVTQAANGIFNVYSERMAARAVRENNAEFVFLGLIALCLDGWQYAFRENIMRLAPLYDAALKTGAQPEAIFDKAASFFSEKFLVEDVRGFPRRELEDKSLAAMYYEEGQDNDGFRYVWRD
jgi:hypothetical protein